MACPVCFGAVEPSVRESMNLGILVLLGVTVGVLGCFARFFIALAKRSREAAHLVEPSPTESNVGRGFTPRQADVKGRTHALTTDHQLPTTS